MLQFAILHPPISEAALNPLTDAEPVPVDPAREHATQVVQRLQAAGFTAYWAGGCVRDMLLGLRPVDYDVATNAVPDQVRKLFGPRNTVAVGAAFGVILVRGPVGAGDIEVATFRTEGPYLDGRRPEHVVFSTPEQDAQRRDFTINGLFFDPLSGQLFDYVGGREDLARKVLRAIGDPIERFTEDKLRVLRAVRMTARFRFDLDPTTALGVRQMADQIPIVSQERIAQELKKILLHPTRRLAVELAQELGVLEFILPELTGMFREDPVAPLGTIKKGEDWLRGLEQLQSPDFELALAVLLAPCAQEGNPSGAVRRVCGRLKLSNQEKDQTCWLIENVGEIDHLPAARVARVKRLLAHRWARNLIGMSRVIRKGAGEADSGANWCERFLDRTPPSELQPPPAITGNDLIQLQLSPGSQFKELLEECFDAQLDGTVRTREEGLEWIRKRLK